MTTESLAVKRGVSQSRDPVIAAQELYEAIIQPDIGIAIFYCAHDFDLVALQKELAMRFKGINLIGCTTAGEITPAGYIAGALTGVSIASPKLVVKTSAIDLGSFETAKGEAVVTHLLDEVRASGQQPWPSNTFAFLLIDGLSMQEEIVVSTLYQRLGGIELIGGSAADDVRFSATHVYVGGEFRQHVAVLSLVQSPYPFVAFRTQHFVQSNTRMVVTRADPSKRTVYEINGEPAGAEYARLVGVETDKLTPLVFATHPVVVRISGEYYVRSISHVNPDGSLVFFCAIDEGIVLTVAKGVDLIENLQQAFEKVRESIGTPQLVLGCDCILRRLEMDRDGIKEKVGAIMKDNNVVGFATYGEQYNAMHVNQTFTGIAIGSN